MKEEYVVEVLKPDEAVADALTDAISRMCDAIARPVTEAEEMSEDI